MDKPGLEHEERAIREYVLSQSHRGEVVRSAEKVATQRAHGERYDVWDVYTKKDRWWVITNPTNLYRQSDFQHMDMAFTFHLGLRQRLAMRNAPGVEDEERERPRRRLAQVDPGGRRSRGGGGGRGLPGGRDAMPGGTRLVRPGCGQARDGQKGRGGAEGVRLCPLVGADRRALRRRVSGRPDPRAPQGGSEVDLGAYRLAYPREGRDQDRRDPVRGGDAAHAW